MSAPLTREERRRWREDKRPMNKLRRYAAWRLEKVACDNPLDWDDNLCHRDQAVQELHRRIVEERGVRRRSEAVESIRRLVDEGVILAEPLRTDLPVPVWTIEFMRQAEGDE